MPIRAVMGLPAGEIDTWSAVYREEYYQEHPSERAKDKINDRETYGYSKEEQKVDIESFKTRFDKNLTK